jgi:hypothetical protein
MIGANQPRAISSSIYRFREQASYKKNSFVAVLLLVKVEQPTQISRFKKRFDPTVRQNRSIGVANAVKLSAGG